MAHAVDVIDDSQTNGTLADRVNESVRANRSRYREERQANLPRRRTAKWTLESHLSSEEGDHAGNEN